MSDESDPDHPDIIKLPIENGRSHLWNKTRLALKYVYENHINDGDWFLHADDDKLVEVLIDLCFVCLSVCQYQI